MSLCRAFVDLSRVEWLGDDTLSEFIGNRHKVLQALPQRPDEASLRQNLYDKMMKTGHKRLKLDLQLFEKKPVEEQTQ